MNAHMAIGQIEEKAQNIHSFHSYFGELEAQGKVSSQFKGREVKREEKEIENQGEVTGLRTSST